MPHNRKHIYWDSGVLLSYINGEPERLPVIDAIFAASANDNRICKIYTSVLSQVEVAFAKTEQEKNTLSADIEEKIDLLWSDTDTLTIIEFHEGIGRLARDLIRYSITQQWSLRAMDALHLATARFLNVDEIHTYDKKWYKFSDELGITIRKPNIEQLSLLL